MHISKFNDEGLGTLIIMALTELALFVWVQATNTTAIAVIDIAFGFLLGFLAYGLYKAHR